MAFSQAGDFMEVVKRQLGLDDETLAIIKIWDKELGPLAKKVKLVGVKSGVLLAEAEASAYIQEVTMRRMEILKKINQNFGPHAKVVKQIKVFLK
jgi:predicted nucleic acid-binding Zn ribbon protein